MRDTEPRLRLAGAALLLGALAALGGCAHYQPRPLDVDTALRAVDGRRLDDPRLQAYLVQHLGRRAPPWDFAALTIAAYYYSPELDVARARYGVARAGVITAGQVPAPSLNLPLQYTTNPKPGDSPYTLGLGLDIPIETAGKRGYRVAQARALSSAALLDIGAAAWQVRSRLRAQLLVAWSDGRRAAVLRRQVGDRRELVHMLARRVELGAGSSTTVAQAQAGLAQDRRLLADAQRQADDALASAAAVMGVRLAALRAVPLALDGFASLPPPLPPAAVRAAAIRDRTDVRAALARYEASQSGLQLALAQQYPDIHLGPGYEFDAGAHKLQLSLLGLPLILPGNSRGPIAQAAARRQQAGAAFEQTVADALAQADRAAAAVGNARVALAAAEAQLVAQRRVLAAARRGFDLGAVDRVALVEARVRERSAQLDRDAALTGLQQAIGAAEQAAQRPFDGPVAPDLTEAPR